MLLLRPDGPDSSLHERTALPVELWDLIFSYVPARADLAALAAASHTFYDISVRHLYRDLSLRRGISTVQQCLVLLRKPHLRRQVRSMAVIFGLDTADRAAASRTRTYARQPTEMFAPAYARLFFRVYNACPRLAALAFSCHIGFDDILNANLCRFPPKVDYFEVGARGPPADILNTLSSVERLYTLKVFGYNVDTLPSSALPKLRGVRCSLRQAETLIPGRPVQQVALEATTLDLDHLPMVIDTLLLSTAALRGLDIKLRSFDFDTLRQIAAAFPMLSHFVLTVLDLPKTGLFDLQSEDWVTRGNFSNFLHLTELEIHAFYGQLPSPGRKTPLLSVIAQVGLACSSLDIVTIVDRGSTHAHEAAVPSYSARRIGQSKWKADITYRNCRNRRSPLFAGYCGDLAAEVAELKDVGERHAAPQCWVM